MDKTYTRKQGVPGRRKGPDTPLSGVLRRLEALGGGYAEAVRGYGDHQEAVEFLLHEIGDVTDQVRRMASKEEVA